MMIVIVIVTAFDSDDSDREFEDKFDNSLLGDGQISEIFISRLRSSRYQILA
jgi:hypothetical protein